MSFNASEVKAQIAILRKADGRLSFRKAWDKVQAVKPELFENRVEAEAEYDPEVKVVQCIRGWPIFG